MMNKVKKELENEGLKVLKIHILDMNGNPEGALSIEHPYEGLYPTSETFTVHNKISRIAEKHGAVCEERGNYNISWVRFLDIDIPEDDYIRKCQKLILDYWKDEFDGQPLGIDDNAHVGLMATTFDGCDDDEHLIEIETNIERRRITYYFDGEGVEYRYNDDEYINELERLNWDDMYFDSIEYYDNNMAQ